MNGRSMPYEREVMIVEEAGKSRRRSNSSHDDDLCFNCSRPGHWASQCKEKLSERRKKIADGKCFSCGSRNHKKFECPDLHRRKYSRSTSRSPSRNRRHGRSRDYSRSRSRDRPTNRKRKGSKSRNSRSPSQRRVRESDVVKPSEHGISSKSSKETGEEPCVDESGTAVNSWN